MSPACEPDNAAYHRGITFVQGNDVVSWNGKHGFQPSNKAFQKCLCAFL
jgi:hypothetical protein